MYIKRGGNGNGEYSYHFFKKKPDDTGIVRMGKRSEDIRTSNPSSPVYPPRATWTLNPSIGTNADLPNVNSLKSNAVNPCRIFAASGPWSANSPHPSNTSNSTLPRPDFWGSEFHSSSFWRNQGRSRSRRPALVTT